MNDIRVPRDFFERLVGKCKLSALGDDHAKALELLAKQQPEGDELEVVAWQDAEIPDYCTGKQRQAQDWVTGGYSIIELCRKSDAQAVIDQYKQDAMRYRWLESNAKLGFDGPPSWGAVLRIETFDANHYKLSQIIDAAMKGERDEFC